MSHYLSKGILMEENFLNDQVQYKLNKYVIFGLFIRIISLFIILVPAREFVEPFFIVDDVSHSENVSQYVNNASSALDLNTFSILPLYHDYPFWSLLCCSLGYIFKTNNVGRFLNIIFSTLCIILIFKLTKRLSKNDETALLAAKLYAFLPYPVLVCCFGIKDIFITYAVLHIFIIILEILEKEKISILKYLFMLFLILALRFTRGAIVEFLFLSFGLMVIGKLFLRKRILYGVIVLSIFLLTLYFLKNRITEPFYEKIDAYSGSISSGTSNSRFLRIKSISEIYKLPITILFATLQPMITNYFDLTRSGKVWLQVISILNISIFPCAIGNFLYIFQKKHNFLFWLSTAILYSSVIILSLGVFRHYLFLLPLIIINYSLYKENPIDINVFNTRIGIEHISSIILVLFVLLVSR